MAVAVDVLHMTQSSIIAVALLIFAAFAFLFGSHGFTERAIAAAKPSAGFAAVNVVALVLGGGLVAAGARVWDRWPRALALILVLAGSGGLQTRPAADAASNVNAHSAQAFRLAGGLIAAAGVVVYIWARRRRP